MLLDAHENRRAPFFQFAQINQSLLQIAQLSIVETAGGFFAIARNERHRRTFIEQCDRRHDLLHGGGEFLSDTTFDFIVDRDYALNKK